MVRMVQWSAPLLLVVACRPTGASTTPTEDVEARANEVRGRLLADCKAGDESACRRIAVSPGATPVEQAPADAPGTEYRRTWAIIEEVEGKRAPAGRIVTGYFCEVREPSGRAALALVYHNALGYMRRVRESKQRRDNF